LIMWNIVHILILYTTTEVPDALYSDVGVNAVKDLLLKNLSYSLISCQSLWKWLDWYFMWTEHLV